jgi:DNA transposition AAA+ family ATPase
VRYRLTDVIDTGPEGRPASEFLVTKDHRRFAEFADACRRERYIGVCYGPPGVGKTLSARNYTYWDTLTPVLADRLDFIADPFEDRDDAERGPAILAEARSVLWTPSVTVTARQLEGYVPLLCRRFNAIVERYLNPRADYLSEAWHVELLIVDEADRLKTTGLEQLRDFFDRLPIGLILIGMPGLEKRLARYPQLYSRIGFAQHYRPLSSDELHFVLAHHWETLGPSLSAEDFTDTEAVATVARITGGNFRLIHRLFAEPTPARDQRAPDRHPRSRRSRPRDTRHRQLTRAIDR